MRGCRGAVVLFLAHIPETSCEDFNAFLDRGVVVGTMKRPEIGFFAEQMKSGWSNVKLYVPQHLNEDSLALPKSCGTVIPERGTKLDTSCMTWNEIWETLEGYAENTSEKELLEKFRAFASIFEGCEQPLQDCAFRVSSQPNDMFQADLLWFDSHVIQPVPPHQRCLRDVIPPADELYVPYLPIQPDRIQFCRDIVLQIPLVLRYTLHGD